MSKRGKAHARRRLQSQLTCRLVGHQWNYDVVVGVALCSRCGRPGHLGMFSMSSLPKPIEWSGMHDPMDGGTTISSPFIYSDLTFPKPVTPWSKIYPVDPTISLDTETGKQYHESCKGVSPKQGIRTKRAYPVPRSKPKGEGNEETINVSHQLPGNYRHTNIRGARSVARPDLCLQTLASKLDIDPSHLGRILRGKAKPSLRLAEKLAGALGQTVDELLTDIRKHTQGQGQQGQVQAS